MRVKNEGEAGVLLNMVMLACMLSTAYYVINPQHTCTR